MKLRVIILLCIAAIGCDHYQQMPALQSTDLAIVIDVTDPRRLWPNAESALPVFNCPANLDASCALRLTPITDMRVTPFFTATLGTRAQTDALNKYGDPQFRKRCIRDFYQSVQNAFSEFYSQFDTAGSLRNSECLTQISNELRRLSTSKSQRKIICVYSELMENGVFDAYTQIRDSVQQLAVTLEQRGHFPSNLSGIQVFFLYSPTSRADDARFGKMAEAYKMVLEQRGAKVEIRASNSNLGI